MGGVGVVLATLVAAVLIPSFIRYRVGGRVNVRRQPVRKRISDPATSCATASRLCADRTPATG